MRSNKELHCPCCQGTKIVRKGRKRYGRQNYLCKGCGRQFQEEDTYKGCESPARQLALQCLCRGSGVRDSSHISGLGKNRVLKLIKSKAGQITIKPARHAYSQVQIDEQWSYVGRMEKKVWMLYAYAPKEDEILAFAMGKRSAETVRHLMMKLKQVTIEWLLTDDWEACKTVLPSQKQVCGKEYTKHIEGINTWFRTRLRRLVRRTTGFSKKPICHYSMMKLLIYLRNSILSYF